eukprot:INCI14710.3.p1 GENE.INCI14710.3~~INCI14710.3.p1  ORF type:complete len:719 (-),score=112.83 INCI14710.3:224-2380(-)
MLLRAMPSTSICSVCGRRRAARDTTTCPKCMTKYADTSSVHSTTQRNNSARSAQGQDRRQGGAVPAATSKAVGERAVAAAAAAAESPQCVRLPRSQLLEKFHNGQLPGRPSREWGLFSLYHFFCGELLQEQRSPATSSQLDRLFARAATVELYLRTTCGSPSKYERSIEDALELDKVQKQILQAHLANAAQDSITPVETTRSHSVPSFEGQKTKRAPNAVSGTLSNAPAVSASLTQQPLRTASRPTSLAVATPASVSKSLPSATKATLLSSSTSSLLSSPGLPSKSRLQSVRTVVPATSPSTSSALSLSQEAPCAPHRAASLGTGGASHNSKKSRQASARSAPHGHEHVAIPKKPQPGPTLTISLGDYAKLRFAQNGGPEAASSGSQGAEIIEIKETSASEASQSSVLNAKAIDSSANEAMVPKAQFEPHFGVCGKDPRADNPHDELIMCDSEDCPSVYHPRCVGLGGVDLEAIENWFCPWCETEKAEKQRRAEDDAPSCEEAVHWLLSHDFSYLFATSPIEFIKSDGGPDAVAQYLKAIPKPMDLGTIRERLDARKYTSPIDVCHEVVLVFDNCLSYNAEGSALWRLGALLRKAFLRRMHLPRVNHSVFREKVPSIGLQQKFMKDVLQFAEELDSDSIFLGPVLPSHFSNPKQSEEYQRLVKEPMCFRTVRTRLTQGNYDNNLKKFVRDVMLPFRNAHEFVAVASRIFNELLRVVHV